jgi:hypothetical protein
MKPVTNRGSGPSGQLFILLVCVMRFFLGATAIAQQPQRVEQPAAESGQEVTPPPGKPIDESAQSTAPSTPEEQPKKKKRLGGRGSFVVAPLPISSPAIGTGLVPILGYIFPLSKQDKISPPSVIGVAGLITNNGSRGFVVGAQLYMKPHDFGAEMYLSG